MKTWVFDGLRLAVDVAIDAGAQIAELTGGSAEAVARREFSGGIVTGAATITGAAELAGLFPPGALAVGTWLVQGSTARRRRCSKTVSPWPKASWHEGTGRDAVGPWAGNGRSSS
ncbi:hypothetical protein [Rhodovulum kholense]|uniref:Uncharacterized protein n=1 Tax=Rhodovulum kholense TaxID=453584 RepID=A0A8E3APF3_9RHOB|nr:hypothetical protein [Rhodovulum kholense]PTW45291.1 hypothetical protein C8N38_114105 [Rhodovulum kholense]